MAKKKSSSLSSLLSNPKNILIIILLVVASAFYVGSNKEKLPIYNNTPSVVVDETANWKTYELDSVDIQFRLPPELSSLGEYKENIKPGVPKGSNICFQLDDGISLIRKAYAGGAGMCSPGSRDKFIIGGTSIDFEAPRGGVFTDLQGFTNKNGIYYARSVVGQSSELPSDIVTKAEVSNIEILKVKSKKIESFPYWPIVPEGWIGALVNTKDSTRPGIVIQMKTDETLDEQVFDQILSTFKFTQ